jgi:hypothetical protein
LIRITQLKARCGGRFNRILGVFVRFSVIGDCGIAEVCPYVDSERRLMPELEKVARRPSPARRVSRTPSIRNVFLDGVLTPVNL